MDKKRKKYIMKFDNHQIIIYPYLIYEFLLFDRGVIVCPTRETPLILTDQISNHKRLYLRLQ